MIVISGLFPLRLGGAMTRDTLDKTTNTEWFQARKKDAAGGIQYFI